MGCGMTRAKSLDFVITNAIVMDPILGIVKADIGIRNGKIVVLLEKKT